ncbi:hypothetical protein F4776DRAFT_671343 [Hypoxylon sp. NC0597]|nr:hypothetical protein F4776DRAFT_671343 [Hypoxylon sp. NC0597]
MDGHSQIPHIDFSNNAFGNAPDAAPPIDWAFDGQQDDVQDIPLITSLFPQLIGEGKGHESTCIECLCSFRNTNQLNGHAKETLHKSYGCTCGAKFSRLDALTRHVSAHSGDFPQHPCEYCTRHQGINGFHRHDHLIQHLKEYHKIDTEDKLPKLRTKASPAPVAAAATITMGESATPQAQIPPFPCTFFGCIKGGANGYLRQVDLLEHQNMMHPFVPQDHGVVPQFSDDMQFNQAFQVLTDVASETPRRRAPMEND